MDGKTVLLKWILWIVFVVIPLVAQFGMLDADTYQESRGKLYNWQHSSLSPVPEDKQLKATGNNEIALWLQGELDLDFDDLLPAFQLSKIEREHISSVYSKNISFLYYPGSESDVGSTAADDLFQRIMQMDVSSNDFDSESMALTFGEILPKLHTVPTELQFRKAVWAESLMSQYTQPSIEEKGYIARGQDLKTLRYDTIINKVADRHNVDPALIKAIITVESYFNDKAESHKGAKGLMQLMPRTAKELGVTDILDPEQNIDAGARYYKWLLERLKGKHDLALAAYNAGIKRVMDYRGIPPFAETRAYVIKVQRYYKKYKQQPNRS